MDGNAARAAARESGDERVKSPTVDLAMKNDRVRSFDFAQDDS
jgi:hypothetical protein